MLDPLTPRIEPTMRFRALLAFAWAIVALATDRRPLAAQSGEQKIAAGSNQAATLQPATAPPRSLPKSLVGNRRSDGAIAPREPLSDAAQEAERPAKSIRSRIGAVVGKVSSPINRWLHGESSALDERHSKATNPADPLKQRRFSPEIEAIHYLANLDSNSYPEVVDSLLASLDDATAAVRFAVLESLLSKCRDRQHSCGRDSGGPIGPTTSCAACRSARKVVARLDVLLLAVDEHGRLKERNDSIRELAVRIVLALDTPDFGKPAETEFAVSETIEPPRPTAPSIAEPPAPAVKPPNGADNKSGRSKFKMFRWFDSGSKPLDSKLPANAAAP